MLVARPVSLVVVARVWRDGDRQLIRLVARSGADERRVAVESSNEAAANRLRSWLDELGDAAVTDSDTTGA